MLWRPAVARRQPPWVRLEIDFDLQFAPPFSDQYKHQKNEQH